MATWLLLTWTRTWSQLLFGAALSLIVAIGLSKLGNVAEPWRFLGPRRLFHALALAASSAGRIVRANLSLARRIWSPSRPLSSGMVVVPSRLRSEGGVAAVGIISSVIVDNQIVDVDRRGGHLQYHAIAVTSDEPEENRDVINGPIEDRLRKMGIR